MKWIAALALTVSAMTMTGAAAPAEDPVLAYIRSLGDMLEAADNDYRQGRLDEAHLRFERVERELSGTRIFTEGHSLLALILIRRAEIHLALGRISDAQYLAQQGVSDIRDLRPDEEPNVRSTPASMRVWQCRGQNVVARSHFIARRFAEAVAAYEAAASLTGDPAACDEAGLRWTAYFALRASGQGAAAEEQVFPRLRTVTVPEGATVAELLNGLKAASEAYDSQAEADLGRRLLATIDALPPTTPDKYELVKEALLPYADAARRAGDPQTALKLADRALAGPDRGGDVEPLFRFRRGAALFDLGRWGEAAAEMKIVVATCTQCTSRVLTNARMIQHASLQLLGRFKEADRVRVALAAPAAEGGPRRDE